MSDIVSPALRSKMMRGIKGKNTRPEVTLRKQLFSLGFRFRLHNNKLPGHPDISLPRYHVAIFVHGCFWHRHQGCKLTTIPSNNADFWKSKFQANIDRDQRTQASLNALGWRVGVVWECAMRKRELPAAQLDQLANWIRSDEPDHVEFYSTEYAPARLK
jgi:DNA mismatch endonuclease (patch repair protein)